MGTGAVLAATETEEGRVAARRPSLRGGQGAYDRCPEGSGCWGALDFLEDVAVVATGIDRRVVSDALWLMIVSDLVYNRSGGFSVQFDGDKEEQDAS